VPTLRTVGHLDPEGGIGVSENHTEMSVKVSRAIWGRDDDTAAEGERALAALVEELRRLQTDNERLLGR
jgi:hypothetical protein